MYNFDNTESLLYWNFLATCHKWLFCLVVLHYTSTPSYCAWPEQASQAIPVSLYVCMYTEIIINLYVCIDIHTHLNITSIIYTYLFVKLRQECWRGRWRKERKLGLWESGKYECLWEIPWIMGILRQLFFRQEKEINSCIKWWMAEITHLLAFENVVLLIVIKAWNW